MTRIVTLAVAVAALAATAALADRPAGWSVLTTWLVHVDGKHLLLDVVAWLALAGWLEPRIGATRLVIWMLSGVAIGQLGFLAIVGPGAHLFGLSAMLVTVAAGGLTLHWHASAGMRFVLIALVGLCLYDLCAADSAPLVAAGGTWLEASPAIARVPGVHLLAAACGSALGLAHLARRQPDAAPRRIDEYVVVAPPCERRRSLDGMPANF